MTDNNSYKSAMELPPRVADLVDNICARNPTHRKYLESTFPKVTAGEFKHLETYLDFCQQRGLSISYLAGCYLLLVADAVNELVYFLQHGEYRYSTFAEVADQVYFNEDYMNQYMHGLAISLIFWTSHLKIHRFFKRKLPTDKPGNYLEVGPGHGSFLMEAMQNSGYNRFDGIDISATSINQTRAVLKHFIPNAGSKCSLKVEDFFTTATPANSCDAFVMGEVLEHVEDPGKFLDKIHELVKDDAFIFITTCVNAPQIDHIYLFRSLEEVADLLSQKGFRIIDSLAVPYEGKSLEECAALKLPVNVAYVLSKS